MAPKFLAANPRSGVRPARITMPTRKSSITINACDLRERHYVNQLVPTPRVAMRQLSQNQTIFEPRNNGAAALGQNHEPDRPQKYDPHQNNTCHLSNKRLLSACFQVNKIKVPVQTAPDTRISINPAIKRRPPVPAIYSYAIVNKKLSNIGAPNSKPTVSVGRCHIAYRFVFTNTI